MDYVVFSIDNWGDLHTQAKFLRHLDTYRAMGKLKRDVVLAIGSYKGALEQSFIMNGEDFTKFVLPTEYVQSQETFLWVTHERQMPFWVKDRDGNTLDSGRLISSSTPPSSDTDGWTYRDDLNLYFYKG